MFSSQCSTQSVAILSGATETETKRIVPLRVPPPSKTSQDHRRKRNPPPDENPTERKYSPLVNPFMVGCGDIGRLFPTFPTTHSKRKSKLSWALKLRLDQRKSTAWSSFLKSQETQNGETRTFFMHADHEHCLSALSDLNDHALRSVPFIFDHSSAVLHVDKP